MDHPGDGGGGGGRVGRGGRRVFRLSELLGVAPAACRRVRQCPPGTQAGPSRDGYSWFCSPERTPRMLY